MTTTGKYGNLRSAFAALAAALALGIAAGPAQGQWSFTPTAPAADYRAHTAGTTPITYTAPLVYNSAMTTGSAARPAQGQQWSFTSTAPATDYRQHTAGTTPMYPTYTSNPYTAPMVYHSAMSAGSAASAGVQAVGAVRPGVVPPMIGAPTYKAFNYAQQARRDFQNFRAYQPQPFVPVTQSPMPPRVRTLRTR